MVRQTLKQLVVFFSRGNRPLRILLFGGVFLAWLVMNAGGWVFGIDTGIGGDATAAYVVLIIASIFIGFGAAFAIFFYLEKVAARHDDHGDGG